MSVHLLVNFKIFLRKTKACTHDVEILMYVHSLYHAYPGLAEHVIIRMPKMKYLQKSHRLCSCRCQKLLADTGWPPFFYLHKHAVTSLNFAPHIQNNFLFLTK